jgi:3-methyl-2-oxobutanoate hydroxymethyltransferase
MSSHPGPAPHAGLTALAELKRDRRPVVMVTAYDYPSALLADEAGVDAVLVGDSAATTVLGLDSTVPVTMEEMIVLGRAARRGIRRALFVVDMPFGSYQVSDEVAVENAVRLVKETGAEVVKLEGGAAAVSRVRAIVAAGIAVCGHIGLTPQSATLLGGYRAQGRSAEAALRLHDDARALEAAGASLLVLECVPSAVAQRISEHLTIPTIGIGAGAGCDGQVLVWHDLLGLIEGRTPRFVERYAELAGEIRSAVARFADDVRARRFPGEEHTYPMPEAERAVFEQAAAAVGAEIPARLGYPH